MLPDVITARSCMDSSAKPSPAAGARPGGSWAGRRSAIRSSCTAAVAVAAGQWRLCTRERAALALLALARCCAHLGCRLLHTLSILPARAARLGGAAARYAPPVMTLLAPILTWTSFQWLPGGVSPDAVSVLPRMDPAARRVADAPAAVAAPAGSSRAERARSAGPARAALGAPRPQETTVSALGRLVEHLVSPVARRRRGPRSARRARRAGRRRARR